jgi:TRAP-type mannitol/chloroaromatic compound transport system permease large subunit
MAVTIFRPNAAPALPLEARNLRQPDGSSGIKSLLVLLAVAVGITYLFQNWYSVRNPAKPSDEVMIYGASLATAVCFLFAVANRKLGLNLVSRMAERVVFVLIPPLALIFLVLGTIFVGIATPTEGGGMGALGALILAMMNRRLNFSLLKQAMDSTTRLSCFVIFILIGSSVFALVFRGVNGDLWVEHLLTSLPGGQLGFFELAFILVPLVGPVAEKMGIDLIWFGILLGVNMQTSFMHPPFGFALFYLRSVAPKEVKTSDIYWGSVPFVLIQIIMVSLIIAFPQLVSVEQRADMKEQLELRIDTPSESSQPEGTPELNFSTGEEKPADGEPQLNFSTEGDRK